MTLELEDIKIGDVLRGNNSGNIVKILSFDGIPSKNSRIDSRVRVIHIRGGYVDYISENWNYRGSTKIDNYYIVGSSLSKKMKKHKFV